MTLQPLSLHGAPFGEAGVANELTPRGTTLRERSDLGGVLINSAAAAREVIERVEQIVGITLPSCAGRVTHGSETCALWLTPRSWIVHCPIAQEPDLASRINAALPDKLVHAALFSDCLCWFEIAGPDAESLIREGGFVSLERGGLPEGHAKRTLLAGVAVLLLHQAPCRWLVGVERSRADWFLLWLKSTAQRAVALGPAGTVDGRRVMIAELPVPEVS